MFERFTDKARQSLAAAQLEARELGHNFIGTEHLLLGLLATDGVASHELAATGVTAEGPRQAITGIVGHGHGPDDDNDPSSADDAEALRAIGIDLDEVRSAVEGAFGEGALDRAGRANGKGFAKRRLGAPPFAPRSKKVLELSLREALSLGHNYIGTEHLLLAIVREGKGVAAQILAERTDLRDLRTKTIDELSRLRPGA
jgi:ATP-dependent Clp protease ATP-binding subunit ClpA